MFENVGYHFSNFDELLYFIDWLSTNFDDPEDFEKFLLEKLPFLADADDSYITFTTVDCAMLMDDEDDDYEVVVDNKEDRELSNAFWNLINNEFHHKEPNDTPIPGTD